MTTAFKTYIDIAINADSSGMYRASWARTNKQWSDECLKDSVDRDNARGPRKYYIVELDQEMADRVLSGKNLGYATDYNDPTTAVPVDEWKPI